MTILVSVEGSTSFAASQSATRPKVGGHARSDAPCDSSSRATNGWNGWCAAFLVVMPNRDIRQQRPQSSKQQDNLEYKQLTAKVQDAAA